MIVALSGGQLDDGRDCIAGALLPKAATNEINQDPLFLPSEVKVGESRDGQNSELKVANLDKIDFGKVDCKEQFEQDKALETEDSKDQVSESSESLSQVRIVMRKRIMIMFTWMMMTMMMMRMMSMMMEMAMMMIKSWCWISASLN